MIGQDERKYTSLAENYFDRFDISKHVLQHLFNRLSRSIDLVCVFFLVVLFFSVLLFFSLFFLHPLGFTLHKRLASELDTFCLSFCF